ncbi:hypothetical protein MSAN_00119300 [Mycena sanguinolenta]|uniref:Uncharacterized protein n=1 Tax=Mycena sanguinolenta TaxID=230812 RepID=A0A8H6ZDG0_9AGAR|nr:hypothetical protein MSAN_00119300 [Mycena sanguinolenta]
MDDHSQPEPGFTHSSRCNVESPSNASGMFIRSAKFSVTGGTFSNFTNDNYTTTPSLASDFRMISMADIDLRHPIRVDERTGVACSRPRERTRVRRLYSAKVGGREPTLTVAMYQGDGAEQEWRSDLAKYMSMRQVFSFDLEISFNSGTSHPNIVQIWGAASSNGMHATLFNDDLIPVQQIVDRHRDSPCSTSNLLQEPGFLGSIRLFLFCNTINPVLGLYELDTSLDWPALYRAYPDQCLLAYLQESASITRSIKTVSL